MGRQLGSDKRPVILMVRRDYSLKNPMPYHIRVLRLATSVLIYLLIQCQHLGLSMRPIYGEHVELWN